MVILDLILRRLQLPEVQPIPQPFMYIKGSDLDHGVYDADARGKVEASG
jgi:hypothetical protein